MWKCGLSSAKCVFNALGPGKREELVVEARSAIEEVERYVSSSCMDFFL